MLAWIMNLGFAASETTAVPEEEKRNSMLSARHTRRKMRHR